MFASIWNAHLHTTKGSYKGSKNIFFVKICFKSCIIKNRSQMYTSEKNTKQLTVRGGGGGGGGNPYGQPDRKISAFFLTTSLRLVTTWSCSEQPSYSLLNSDQSFCPTEHSLSPGELWQRKRRSSTFRFLKKWWRSKTKIVASTDQSAKVRPPFIVLAKRSQTGAKLGFDRKSQEILMSYFQVWVKTVDSIHLLCIFDDESCVSLHLFP